MRKFNEEKASLKLEITISDLEKALTFFRKVSERFKEQPHFHWKLVEDGWDTKYIDVLIKEIKKLKDLVYLSYISMFLEENQVYIEADFHKKALVIYCEKAVDIVELLKAWRNI